MEEQPDSNTPFAYRVYAVPRRYDLATLFVVSLAYALLFGVMRAVHGPPIAFALVAGYVTVVGLGQAVFFRGRLPRAASVMASLVFVCAAGISFAVYEADWGPLFVFLNPCALVAAALVGYAVGAFIGGIFLAADLVRLAARRLLHRT